MDRMMITTKRKQLSPSWATDVAALERAIQRFTLDRPLTNDCKVVFFEVARDGHLHVNVTHKHQTAAAAGWAGPASMPEGFVHNRRFGDTAPSQMIRHIRNMVFAARI